MLTLHIAFKVVVNTDSQHYIWCPRRFLNDINGGPVVGFHHFAPFLTSSFYPFSLAQLLLQFSVTNLKKGTIMKNRLTLVPSPKADVTIALKLFLKNEKEFESFFWVKCIYVLHKWKNLEEVASLFTRRNRRIPSNVPLKDIWGEIKSIDSDNSILPKKISESGIRGVDKKLIPDINNIEKEGIFLSLNDDMLKGNFREDPSPPKTTSVLVIGGLEKYYTIGYFDDFKAFIEAKGLTNLYSGDVYKERAKWLDVSAPF